MVVLLAVGAAGLGAAYYWTKNRHPRTAAHRTPTTRGTSTKEFVTTGEAKPPEKIKRSKKVVREVPWPTYGFDSTRSHVAADFAHRPPYRRVWLVETDHLIEFPPAVAYDTVYVAQVKGRFIAINAKTGKIRWQHRFGHCEAAGPAVWKGVVYQPYMQALPCNRFPRDQPGFLVAMDADTGKVLWRFRGKPFESSPLIVRGVLYIGSWDHRLYAINARTKALRWSFEADGEVNTSAAYWNGAVYFATDAGSVYALDARTGRELWKRSDGSEYFYATPTVAYGRVYIGNTNGVLYAYGAKTGDLLWVSYAGSYIYTAAAVWDKKVYVGSYDGGLYAFDAATGDRKWRYEAPAAIHGAPTVMGGLIYFSTCEFCGVRASRYAKQGPRGTYALNARTGRLVWQTKPGQYSPIVADREHVYLVGKTRVYALEEVSAYRTRRAIHLALRTRVARKLYFSRLFPAEPGRQACRIPVRARPPKPQLRGHCATEVVVRKRDVVVVFTERWGRGNRRHSWRFVATSNRVRLVRQSGMKPPQL